MNFLLSVAAFAFLASGAVIAIVLARRWRIVAHAERAHDRRGALRRFHSSAKKAGVMLPPVETSPSEKKVSSAEKSSLKKTLTGSRVLHGIDLSKIAELWAVVGTLLAREKYADAEKKLIEILAVDEREPRANLELARLYLRDGKLSRAELLAEAAVELDPENPLALETLGELLWQLKKYDASLRAYLSAHRASPRDHALIVKIADIYAARHDFTAARRAMESALELQREHLPYLWKYLEILKKTDDGDAQIHALRYILELDPRNGAAKQELRRFGIME